MPFQNTIFIALGSNLGDLQGHCKRALQLLKGHPCITVQKISSWYKTEALTLGGEAQPDYLNGVVQIETNLSPQELLKVCKAIEKKMGRAPSKKRWQPRPIDLDILFYGDLVLDTPELKIPHPELHKRRFVLKPLSDINPEWAHPVLKKTAHELYADLS